MASTSYLPNTVAVRQPPSHLEWTSWVMAFCAFFSSLYMVVKLPVFAPYFPTGAKEVILLLVVAVCFGYAVVTNLSARDDRHLTSPAFLTCFAAIALITGHILFGASRQTISLAALQLTLFPLLFVFVGGVQTDLRQALTWLSIALVATGVVSIAFEFSDAITGDAYILNNSGRTREFLEMTWISYERSRREAGIFEGGIQLCSHLGLAVMGAVYLVLRKRYAWICISILPLFAIGIALTLSRLGLLAMLAGLLVLFGAFRNRRLLQVVGAATFAVGGLLFCSTVFPETLEKYVQRSLSIFTGDAAQEARVQAWDLAFNNMLDSPFGIGIGTAGGKVQRQAQILIPESTFLKFGVELGFVAMIAFVGIYLFAFRRALLAARRIPLDDQHVEMRLDTAFLSGLVFATFVNHAFVQAIEYFSYGLISMMVLGMALNVQLMSDSQRVVVESSRDAPQ